MRENETAADYFPSACFSKLNIEFHPHIWKRKCPPPIIFLGWGESWLDLVGGNLLEVEGVSDVGVLEADVVGAAGAEDGGGGGGLLLHGGDGVGGDDAADDGGGGNHGALDDGGWRGGGGDPPGGGGGGLAAGQGVGDGLADEGGELGQDAGHQVAVVVVGGGGGLGGDDALDGGGDAADDGADQAGVDVVGGGGAGGAHVGGGDAPLHGGPGADGDEVVLHLALLGVAVDAGAVGDADEGAVGVHVLVRSDHVVAVAVLLLGDVGLLLVICHLEGVGVDRVLVVGLAQSLGPNEVGILVQHGELRGGGGGRGKGKEPNNLDN